MLNDFRDDEPRCLHEEDGTCRGELSERMSAGGTCMITRCEKHWEERDALEDRLRVDYPDTDTPPIWFDPENAGERWNDDY